MSYEVKEMEDSPRPKCLGLDQEENNRNTASQQKQFFLFSLRSGVTQKILLFLLGMLVHNSNFSVSRKTNYQKALCVYLIRMFLTPFSYDRIER